MCSTAPVLCAGATNSTGDRCQEVAQHTCATCVGQVLRIQKAAEALIAQQAAAEASPDAGRRIPGAATAAAAAAAAAAAIVAVDAEVAASAVAAAAGAADAAQQQHAAPAGSTGGHDSSKGAVHPPGAMAQPAAAPVAADARPGLLSVPHSALLPFTRPAITRVNRKCLSFFLQMFCQLQSSGFLPASCCNG